MALLGNFAMRHTEKSLRPFMRGDERLIEYDIVNLKAYVPAEGGEAVMKKIAVVLSSHAVYLLREKQDAIRIPYESVIFVAGRGNSVWFQTHIGNEYLAEIIGRPQGDLYTTIVSRLEALHVHEEDVPVPGGIVKAKCRPVEEGKAPVWIFGADNAIDLEGPEVKAALAAHLAPVANRLHCPLPL